MTANEGSSSATITTNAVSYSLLREAVVSPNPWAFWAMEGIRSIVQTTAPTLTPLARVLSVETLSNGARGPAICMEELCLEIPNGLGRILLTPGNTRPIIPTTNANIIYTTSICTNSKHN
jgi:hypothetical protein